ncbi:TCP-1/cpn60 chaperonin family protein [Fervidicoccus fontis]|uniref:Thermosome n=2 Tax=Fervidicoccus fontis TaxID=683846 RepID=I0A1X5_FERFK|nr:thermosome subunit alpha [Fervidicoccus fontis]AFH42982.1 thermosome [Fervidicoccus fontis Kam940]MBE9391462.1 TCP-1/cpn60 chaperonin family protein [Fervidicoccus fontis]
MSYGVPVLILKEGTQRATGRDALRANIMAARTLAEILKTSLGPRGLDKMLVDSFGDVTVTNDGVTIVKEMEVNHPAAKLLVEVAKAQDAEVGDGTTTAVVLAGALLEKAEALLDQNIHPTVIMDGFSLAMHKALEILDSIAVEVKPEDTELLKKLVKTSISSKYIGSGETLEKLTDLIVEAAKLVAEPKPQGKGYELRLDNIKIEKKKGESLNDSMLIKGIVLDKEVVHPGMPKRVENAKIALLDAPLEIKKPEISAKINITSPEQMKSFLDEETKLLKEMVDKIAEVGANVVIAQKGIDDVAQHFLAKRGILAVRRVKRSDMEKLERATGGRIVTSIRDLRPEDLGEASLVEERKVGNEKMLFVEGVKNAKSVTILLRGANDIILDEAERSINDALHVLRNVMKDPKIVGGGGAPEIELALQLRKFATTVGGKKQLAIEAFADAMETIPMILAETSGIDALEALMKLRQLHTENKIFAGVNALTEKIIENTFEENIIEPIIVKKQAVKSASEATITILKIDDLIAAQAPKKKEEKGEGSEGGRMPQGAGMPEF